MPILVAVEPVAFRRGIDGLARLCWIELKTDPFCGYVFIFRNKSRTAIKILTYWMCANPASIKPGISPVLCSLPLPELTDHIARIDADKPVLVYCASGRRSFIAAQLLSGQGFKDTINVIGGFNAWNGAAALLDENKGLSLFDGVTSVESALAVAYSLEGRLQEFYESMGAKVTSDPVRQLFRQLSQIEVKHQTRILAQLSDVTGKAVTRKSFEAGQVSQVLEGGLTTEEYANLLMPSYDTVTDTSVLYFKSLIIIQSQ